MININMSCAVIMGHDVFFSALDFNALLKMNLLSGKTEYICKFEKEKGSQRLHVKAFGYQNRIWFIPLFGKLLACFNVDRNEMEYFEIPKRVEGRLGKDEFWLHTSEGSLRPQFFDAGKINEKKIYLIPATSDTVVILNMETNSIQSFFGVVDVDKELIGCGTVCGDKLWMAPYIGKYLISLDMKSGEIERIEYGYELGQYFGICSFENRLWFSPQKKNQILIYDINQGKFKQIDYSNTDEQYNLQRAGCSYRDIVLFNKSIYLLSGDSERIINLDKEGNYICNLDSTKEHNFGVLIRMEEQEGKLFIFSYSYGYVMSIDHKNKLKIYGRAKIEEDKFETICNDNNILVDFCNQFLDGIPEENLGLSNYIKAIMAR